jgi:hypothetical protein
MREEAYAITRAHCNSCKQETKHQVIQERSHSESIPDQGVGWTSTYQMLECCGCDDILLREIYSFSEDPDDTITYYPPRISRVRPNWSVHLPENLRTLLIEIYAALHADSRRLAMMGARTAFEYVMVSKAGDQGSFAGNIKALETGGYVSKTHCEFLEVALDAGSATVHRFHKPTAEQLGMVMDILENLLQSLYALPKHTDRLKRVIPPRPPKAAKP